MPPLVACFMRVAFAGEVLNLIISLTGPAVRESCMCTKVRRPTHVAERKRARADRSWLSALVKYLVPGINHACIGCLSVPLQQALWLWSWCAAYMRMTVPVASLKACMAGSSCCRPN